MCPDLFSEEAPCGLIIAKDHLQYGRKRPLSLCILGGRLREVRLYSTSNITLGIEMLTTKKKVKLFVFFASWRDFFYFGATDSLFALIFCHAPSSLFTTTIGSLPHWRTNCTTWTEKRREIDWELVHLSWLSHLQVSEPSWELWLWRFLNMSVFSYS